MNAPRTTPRQVMELLQRGEQAMLLDVRTPMEFESLHVQGAQLMPLDQLSPEQVRQHRRGDEPIYVLCQAGSRAAQAAQRLIQAGLDEVYVVEGGTRACEAAGLPLHRGQAVMSLERQVRIAAGALVLLGVVLGWLVQPLFYLLAGFVGGGLVFAGLTDTCGMAMLLARLPWNRRGGQTGSSCATKTCSTS